MMRSVGVVAALVAMTQLALADSHKLLVLQSEGRADAKTRAKVDAAIVKLAKASGDQVQPGEITYSDAAAMVGCKPDEASCKDDVISTLAVDEIVLTTVNPKPGGLEVSVRRIGKGGATKDATVIVATDKPDKLEGIAPLFGGKAPATTTPPPATTTTPPTTSKQPTTTPPATTTAPPATTTTEPAATTEPTTPSEPTRTATASEEPTTTPPVEPHEDKPKDRHKLYIAGMGVGGGLLLLSFIMWGNASSIQNDIDNAPTRTRADLLALRDLEDKGDTYAGVGNLFFLTGAAIGGVSTYLYIRYRRAHRSSSTAMLAPAVFDHGAGLVLTLGGSK